MHIKEIRERTVPISRYADPSIPSGGLETSIVAVVTDVQRDGAPVVGFGFSSIGRYGQASLIRDRFSPRLLAASRDDLSTEGGDTIDPFKAWACRWRAKNRVDTGFGKSPSAPWTWRFGTRRPKSPGYRFTG